MMVSDANLNNVICFDTLLAQCTAIWKDESDHIAVLANIAALLFSVFGSQGWHWVGFYRVLAAKDMVLGPFQGPVACTRIAASKGVCGHCVSQKQPVFVPNVHAFPGHIACSTRSKSEWVGPVYVKGVVSYVLDIDSLYLAGIDEESQQFLTQLCDVLGRHFS